MYLNRTKQRVNFTRDELKLLKTLVLEHPIINSDAQDQMTVNMKKLAWDEVVVEFNSKGLNTERNLEQLKSAWKRIKKKLKAQNIYEKRSGICVDGEPPSSASDEDSEMEDMFVDQKPAAILPDCGYNVGNDPEAELMGSRSASPKQNFSTAGLSTFGNPLSPTPSVQPPETPREKTFCRRSFAEQFHNQKMEFLKREHEMRMKVLEDNNYCAIPKKKISFEEQLHYKKMEYLKLEHELRMKVLAEEKSYWALMKANAQQLFVMESEKNRKS